MFIVSNSAATDGFGGSIAFGGQYSGTNVASFGRIAGVRTGATYTGALTFYTRAAGGVTMPERMRIDQAGNVGIGTTGPGALLNLKGTLSSALTGTVSVTINTATVTGVGTAFTTELAVGDSIKIGTEIFTVSAIASATSLTLDSNHLTGASGVTAYRDPTLFAVDNGDAVNKLTITRSGNVGIGTTVLGYPLTITKASGNPQLAFQRTTDVNQIWAFGIDASSNFALQDLTSGGDVIKVIQSNHNLGLVTDGGNVGIGTTNPGKKLEVYGTTVTDGALKVLAKFSSDAAYSASPFAGIGFAGQYSTGGSPLIMAGVGGGKENGTVDQYDGFVAFYTRATGYDVAEKMRITSAGNVGIGTTNPGAILAAWAELQLEFSGWIETPRRRPRVKDLQFQAVER